HRVRLLSRWSLGQMPRSICALIAWLILLVAATTGAAETTMRLRIEWGGGGAGRWTGQISTSEGRLMEPQPLGSEADEPGSMWETGGKVNVATRSERRYD